MPGRSRRGDQEITKQRIKLESRYLPALFYCKNSQTCTTTFLLTYDRIYSEEVVLWDFIARNEVMIWRT